MQTNQILTVENISVTFKRKVALTEFSCAISQGEVIGLVGPNGAGKTTLMKAMLGFVPLKQGQIKKGDAIKLGSLIEQPGLYPFLTGLEQLRLFAASPMTETQLDRLISLLDLGEFIDQKIKGYSLGMKQRLGIALALLNQPQLVILDEPMNGLDPYSVNVLKKAIQTYQKKGTAFLISSHILSELEQLVDRVLLVKAGHLVETIDHPELLPNFEESLVAKLA